MKRTAIEDAVLFKHLFPHPHLQREEEGIGGGDLLHLRGKNGPPKCISVHQSPTSRQNDSLPGATFAGQKQSVRMLAWFEK